MNVNKHCNIDMATVGPQGIDMRADTRKRYKHDKRGICK